MLQSSKSVLERRLPGLFLVSFRRKAPLNERPLNAPETGRSCLFQLEERERLGGKTGHHSSLEPGLALRIAVQVPLAN